MTSSSYTGHGDIIHLNVGGERFSTSKQTLSWMPDTFFTSLLSGRISTLKDETGAIFIDRDPSLFRIILQYLRTREISAAHGPLINELRHEAEFYGITGLVKRLALCQDLTLSTCGDVLFCGYLPSPEIPLPEVPATAASSQAPLAGHTQRQTHASSSPTAAGAQQPSTSAGRAGNPHDTDTTRGGCRFHCRTSSADLNKLYNTEIAVLNTVHCNGQSWVDPLRVRMVKAHHNWIVVAYAHFVTCYRNKDSTGWQVAFTSPYQEQLIDRVAINAKMTTTAAGHVEINHSAHYNKMLAISYGASIRLWSVADDGTRQDVGIFQLGVTVEYLFFIGYQLVALSSVGKIGVWHAMTRNWQTQEVLPIASFDTAGSFLLLGCTNGSIYYIDMQKFPLRMKDNDLLVTELYHDPSNDVITAISVYLTPKTNVCGNWIEIAYGTSAGTVRVIVQHPETVGHGPQLFQTFTVHRHPITKVRLSEKLLISVCCEYNHVRTWTVMRFRGMISTQPGSTPLSSYKVLTLEEADTPHMCLQHANEIGPYGEQDDEQVFIQKVLPESDQLIVRLANKGKRVCSVKSVDGSNISGFCVHECDGRIGSTRPRRYLFTGHTSGAIQMWDLTTALDMVNKPQSDEDGSPAPAELLRLLESCELTYSHGNTPCVSPSPHLSSHHAPHGHYWGAGLPQHAPTPLHRTHNAGSSSNLQPAFSTENVMHQSASSSSTKLGDNKNNRDFTSSCEGGIESSSCVANYQSHSGVGYVDAGSSKSSSLSKSSSSHNLPKSITSRNSNTVEEESASANKARYMGGASSSNAVGESHDQQALSHCVSHATKPQHVLKPTNAAFLSHHQSPGTVDGGTEC